MSHHADSGAHPVGICLPLRGFGAAQAVRLGRLAEELGYDSVWVSEVASYDAIAVATAIAATTERIRIGTGIVPVTTRTPALHAMAASTLGDVAGGRAVIGYGMSTEPIIEGWHGQTMPKAIPATRDLFEIIDQAFTGDATDYRGELKNSKGFRLEAPTPTPPKRYLGALGPMMRRYARENLDGLILNFAPRSKLAEISKRERPLDGRPFERTLPIRTAVGEDPSEAIRRFRREAASYLRVPQYSRSLRELRMGEVLDRVAGLKSLQQMADALPEEFVIDMAVIGSEDTCREQLAGIHADGVTPLIVPVVAPGDSEGYEQAVTTMAPRA